MTGVDRREAGRALVIDPDGRALMVRGVDPAEPDGRGFWFTPGGGLDPGESVDAGIRRELAEELGLHVDVLGPMVMHRRVMFPFDGRLCHQEEVIHVVHVDAAFEAVPAGLTALEVRVITGFRWLSADELRAVDEDVYPLVLADLLDFILAHGPPDPPWVEDLIGEA